MEYNVSVVDDLVEIPIIQNAPMNYTGVFVLVKYVIGLEWQARDEFMRTLMQTGEAQHTSKEEDMRRFSITVTTKEQS